MKRDKNWAHNSLLNENHYVLSNQNAYHIRDDNQRQTVCGIGFKVKSNVERDTTIKKISWRFCHKWHWNWHFIINKIKATLKTLKEERIEHNVFYQCLKQWYLTHCRWPPFLGNFKNNIVQSHLFKEIKLKLCSIYKVIKLVIY